MRRSGRLFIALGAGLALVAVGLVAVVLLSGGGSDGNTSDSEGESVAQETPREISVIVAARDVPGHTVLTQEDLTEKKVLSTDVPDDALRSDVEAIGFAYSMDLVPGQVLLQSNRELPGLANSIEPGLRAYALPVDIQSLVGGQIRDDDRIDIIFNTHVTLQRVNPTYPLEAHDNIELEDVRLTDPETGEQVDAVLLPDPGMEIGPTYPYPGEPGSRFWVSDIPEGEPVGKVVLQNVRVLRVVSDATTPPGSGDSSDTGNFLVLELAPDQAEVVEFLTTNGTFQVALRNPEDSDVATTPGVTMNMLVDNWGLAVPKTVRLPEAEGQ